MNRVFQIACVSLNTTALDLEGNFLLHTKVLEDSSIDQASIVLFPELSLSGYGCEDAFYRPDLWRKCQRSIVKLLPFTKNRVVVVGAPVFYSPYLYNASIILYNQKIIGIVPKKNLANTGIHYEKRWFTEWQDHITDISLDWENISGSEEEIFEDNLLMGDLSFFWNGLRFGLEICEDSWVVNRPSHSLSEVGADLILCPGASHFAFGKYNTRSRIFLEGSRAQSNVFAFANLVGNESGRAIFDGGNIIAKSGEAIGIGKRLNFESTQILTANIDLDDIQNNRSANHRRSKIKLDDNLYPMEISLAGSPFRKNLFPSQSYDKIPQEDRYSIFTDAVTLGLFDYLRKSKTKGFTLSLSGGADSSSIAILVSVMEKEVRKSLGDKFWESLNFTTPLLTTIYQKTKNNTDITQSIAKSLADALATEHHEIEIDAEVDLMVNSISKTLGRTLNWTDDGIALQNIQARVRSPLVWLLANTKNHLLLSTGNRSEASVGYTTMDGDSSGSIAPITGVSKKFILEWLHYIGSGSDSRIQASNALSELLTTKPSAELKPLEDEQEDEKDLMPYPILQEIEYHFVKKGRSKEQILSFLQNQFDTYSANELQKFIDRFIFLFKASQWKRERLPISFHLDEYGLDPKTSFRYPILSGKD
ncbi:NAD(+) synthase [Leptospira sp. GIMC2001]|uniref:NAD(+) synthase n=1 Tax=Leptospira sp. GIMC2001 TaxID=1513297 RepID=UPI002349475B|nr:NAD(+) synthase [Leptospira sp. GIMC2001]WCL48433.1 NAD(+) synthase [Leptospira sp. GIMC2001]